MAFISEVLLENNFTKFTRCTISNIIPLNSKALIAIRNGSQQVVGEGCLLSGK